MKIAVISTIKFNSTSLKKAFEAGLKGATHKVVEKVGFVRNDMDQAVLGLDDLQKYDLIVTVGGLALAIAALNILKSAGDVPFISLVGGKVADTFPGKITKNFWGGVLLNTFGHNDDRVFHLTGDDNMGMHKFPASDICLLVNPHSGCYAEETANWPPQCGKIYEAGTKDEIKSKLMDFKSSGSLAIIISADPFFQDNMDTLIPAANETDKHVCYPLQDYAMNGSQKLLAKKHTLHGPSLVAAYTLLGEKAGKVMSDEGARVITPVPTQVVDPQ
jgi:hypothetical protein